MRPVRGNIIKGISKIWYLMDGPEIISRHSTRESAEVCLKRWRRVRKAQQNFNERKGKRDARKG